ncbi:hypothetical protein EC973_000715 [Apophysomyces ossiformis]|uniref:NADH:flavin oxidoreductase/NADH oxidase N-terminal domain-containing protein n=1 Tax=Apophysomyces ossiformis TaxID=679940 RepID=A0A8H7EPV7_9FUNG|nr:hypothetical protein EC973_000715 [Apophysomyces ossiformis]
MATPLQASNNKVPAGTALGKTDRLLFTPKTIKSITFHNRVVVSPMCMYSAENGFPNDFHLAHYTSFAFKGAGLVFFEATAVEPRGRISPHDLGIWSDDHIDAFRRVADSIKAQGSVPGIQIAHAGRKASSSSPFSEQNYRLLSSVEGGWSEDVWGPSDLAFDEAHAKPHAMTVPEIEGLVQKFADAAVRADKAGIEVLEIHGAHGYLIHSFLSGNSNKRTDEYGGSVENRLRFALEIARAVRAVWPSHKPLFFRVSATDYRNYEPLGGDPEGWDVNQTIALAKELKQIGVDLIDCSSGGNLPNVKYPVKPLYQVPFAAAVKREADIDTGAVGIITEPKDAELILKDSQADLIFIAREFLRDSSWVLLAGQELGVDIKWPNQYSRAKRVLRSDPGQKEAKVTTIP